MKVIKKDGTIEQFDGQKSVNAVSKSAARAMIELDDTQYHEIVSKVMGINIPPAITAAIEVLKKKSDTDSGAN